MLSADPNAILVPDLLDIQEPKIDIQLEEALRFVFEYQYLPKSIMPRFIVRMHKDIKANRSWRTGVVLEDRSLRTTAVVTADEKAKRIYITVVGAQKRDYFATLRKAISDINLSFEKLIVTELVPLPGAAEVLVEYTDLIGHELSKREEIFIGKLGRAFSVQLLLNGLEDAERRSQYAAQTVINVTGTYVNQPAGQVTALTALSGGAEGGLLNYQPHTWEKIVSYATGLIFVATVLFLVIRNQPIADPNFVVLLRILLSLVIAVFGASVPGMLHVDMSTKKGIAIRASGALALFVISFAMTPKVHSSTPRVVQRICMIRCDFHPGLEKLCMLDTEKADGGSGGRVPQVREANLGFRPQIGNRCQPPPPRISDPTHSFHTR